MAAATTIIAGVGLAITAGTTAASFAQAAKQRKLMADAQQKAAESLAEAEKKLDVNFYDQLAIQKEPYELQREALLSAGAQALQAGVESGRGAPATAGRVMMGMNEAQADVRTAQGEELMNLQKLSAAEESRLRDVKVQVDLAQSEGAQLAARDAQEAAAAATTAGMAGLQSMGQQAIQMAPLYGKDLAAQQSALSGVKLSQSQTSEFKGEGADLMGPPTPAMDFSNVGSMTKSQYNDFLKSLSPQQRQMLFTNPTYLQNYNELINPFTF